LRILDSQRARQRHRFPLCRLLSWYVRRRGKAGAGVPWRASALLNAAAIDAAEAAPIDVRAW
jgi:hypothetical protein